MPLITGIGWITAGGMGRGRKHRRFDMTPGHLPVVTRESVIDGSFAHFGRMDAFSKLGFGGIALALKDAGLHEWSDKRQIGMIACTVYGCLQTDTAYLDTTVHDDGRLASPALFSYTLPNCFLGEAAWYFGTTGLSYVIYDPQHDTLSSLEATLLNMRLDEFETGVAGIVDDPPDEPQALQTRPGAVFVVIENKVRKEHPAYGRIELGGNQNIYFNDQCITTFTHLLRACSKVFQGKERADS